MGGRVPKVLVAMPFNYDYVCHLLLRYINCNVQQNNNPITIITLNESTVQLKYTV